MFLPLIFECFSLNLKLENGPSYYYELTSVQKEKQISVNRKKKSQEALQHKLQSVLFLLRYVALQLSEQIAPGYNVWERYVF